MKDASMAETETTTLYEAIGGDPTVRALTRRFYELMDTLPEAARCRAVHPPDLSGSEEKFYEYLTGRQLDFPLCGVYRFGPDGLLASERIYYDRATVLRQLGVFREPTTLAGRVGTLLAHPLTILGALFSG